MIRIQVVPQHRLNAHKMLRDKVTREASTWHWANKAKTRLRHDQIPKGYIKIAGVEGVLIADVYPKNPKDSFYLSEKLVGRLVAWFEGKLVAINIQFVSEGD